MSNDNTANDTTNLFNMTPDHDHAPVPQDRRSMSNDPEPTTFANAPEEDDGPETMAAIEALSKDDRRSSIPPVRWADDKDQPDYAHLMGVEAAGITPDKTFKLTPEVLELLIKANSFKPDGPNGKFVFALRGGQLANGKKQIENAPFVEIMDKRPDHRNFRCTIGFYDRANKTITAYLASTVPNVKYMTNYYKKTNKIGRYKNIGSNIMPTGCYVFRKNAHGGGRINPAMRMTKPDSLKEDTPMTILRTSNDLSYKHNDFWDHTTPYDNIHCAYSTTSFSSAGCQTICGANHKGPWGRFQNELKKHPWNTRFDYMLLTGREAAIAAKIISSDRADKDALTDTFLRRLRVGSYGPKVAALQRKLGYSGKTQYFGPSTRKALVDRERKQGSLNSDAIFSPADDQVFGWRVYDTPDVQDPAGTPTPGPTTPGSAPQPPPGLIPESLILVAGPPGSTISSNQKTLEVPGQGTWTVGPTAGRITFTPLTGFNETVDPVTYSVSNTAGGTATALVNVKILDVNKAPVVQDDAMRTVESQPVAIAVLQNDTDTDGTIVPSTLVLASAPAGSQITADGKSLTVPGKGIWLVDPFSGQVQFSPVAGFTGVTQATYQVADEDGATATGTITVTVTPKPKAPILVKDEAETPTGTPVTIDILANDASGLEPPKPPQPTPQPTPKPLPPTGGGTPAPQPTPTPIPAPPTDGKPPISGVVMMTEEQLRRFAPKAKDKYVDALVAQGPQTLAQYGINANAMRLSHFLGQIGHESGGFTIDRESLYYTSAKRIQQVWPSRFKTLSYASQFVKNEEKLAGKVYDGRLRDLGNTQPGDGYKYRGRGLIQITGRGNYADMGRKIGVDLENNPDLATQGVTALKIAARTWYDRTRSNRTMNQLAEENRIKVITVRINGGHTNIGQRRQEFQRAWNIWGTGSPPLAVSNPDVMERGQKGDDVKVLQRLLVKKGYFPADETIDGNFGGQTQQALMRFQFKADTNVNGIADKTTMQALRAAPDNLRRGAARPPRQAPRSARDPRHLEHTTPTHGRRDHDTKDDQSAAWKGYLRLAAVVLAILAIAIPCIVAMQALQDAPRRSTVDLAVQMIGYFYGSGAMLAASLALAGLSTITKTMTGSSAGSTQALEDQSPTTSPDTPFVPEPVLGTDTPLTELGFDDAFFENEQPIRHAPGLPEDVDLVPTTAPEEVAAPEFIDDTTLEEPGAPMTRNGMVTTASKAPQPFPVSTPDVALVLIKMFGGDNNLSFQVDNDLEEITQGIRAANATHAMIALADRKDAPASVIEITPHGERRILGSLGEIDTGDPATLANFLARALVTYPNARKAIGFWDHGTGVFDEFDEDEVILTRSTRAMAGRRARPARRLLIPASKREALRENPTTRGMLHDNTGGILTNVEAGRMLAAAFRRAGQDNPIDLIYSDTCLNGMIEVLEELGDYAQCIVASSDTEPGAGWDYEQWISATGHEFPQTAGHWGQRAVRAFSARYLNDTNEHPCTLAAFDTANSITEAFADVVDTADSSGLAGWFLINHIRSQTQAYDNRDAYDLLDFAARLVDATRSANDQPELTSAAVALDAACSAARLDFAAHGHKVRGSKGLAFWFPSNRTSLEDNIRTYRHLKFAQLTGWADYLERNYTGVVS